MEPYFWPKSLWNKIEELHVSKIRVLIADDHSIVRAGVRSLLEGQANIEVVGEARRINAETLILHTAANNVRGQKLFKKHGFSALGAKKNFYPKGQDALVMYKDVS